MGKNATLISPHNWEIMHPIVIEFRRGPLPAQLFPSWTAVFCTIGQKKECAVFSLQNPFVLYARDILGSNKRFWLYISACYWTQSAGSFLRQPVFVAADRTDSWYMTGCRWLFWDPSVALRASKGPVARGCGYFLLHPAETHAEFCTIRMFDLISCMFSRPAGARHSLIVYYRTDDAVCAVAPPRGSYRHPHAANLCLWVSFIHMCFCIFLFFRLV